MRRIVVACFFSAILLGTINTRSEEVEIRLQLSDSEIRAEDPLFIRLVISNKAPHSLRFDRELGTIPGTILFEVCEPNASTFIPATTRLQGIGHGFLSIKRQQELRPNESVYCYECIFRRGENRAVFEEVGQYAIRARIIDNDGIRGESEIAKCLVRPIDSTEKSVIQKNGRMLALGVGPGGIPDDVDSQSLASLSSVLSDSVLKRTLVWMVAVVKLREANSNRDLQTAMGTLQDIKRPLNPISREIVSITTAHEWYRLRDFDQMQRELRYVKESNYHTRSLRRNMLEYLREYGDKNVQ